MPRKGKANLRSRRSRPRLYRPPIDELKLYSASAGLAGVYDGAGFIMNDITGAITQGIGDNQRIGDNLLIKQIQLHVNLYNGIGVGSNVNTTFRVIIFQWLNDSAVPPTVAQLFLSSSMNGGVTSGTFSFRNQDYLDQAVFLWDSGFVTTVGSGSVATVGAVGGESVVKTIRAQIPLQRLQPKTQFYAAGVTGPNHVFVFITTDQAHNAAVEPQASYGYMLRFLDA